MFSKLDSLRRNALPRNPQTILFGLLLLLMAPGMTSSQTKSAGQEKANTQDPLLIHREYKPVVGQPHVDFILPSIDGDKQIQLSAFRGKKVLLLHFASW